ncbi:HNH endonuclease signature motif containing protein [Nocardioides alcanivorans]|uniref:HNH endonuclease signature motif containing protein n=1 Tax=Nocardioides alcanivorans TaxID=2897352 RepID=UPI001F432762|nr:HNH endonuclease signature motif containing protein [Nocardioides alcanivorans]
MLEIDARHQPYEVDDLDLGSLLGFVAEHAVDDRKVGRRQLRLVYRLAVLNPPTPERPAAVAGDQAFVLNHCEDKLAGAGTPDVALFAVEDYSAAAGISRPSALALVADTLDLHHRLPRLWERVEALEVPTWKARRVAQQTRNLSYEAARWFDTQLEEAGRWGWPTINKWIACATAKFHPEKLIDPNAPYGKGDWNVTLRHLNKDCAEGANEVSGTSELLATGDSLDLERFHQLLRDEAERMRSEGDNDPIEHRLAKAIGRLVDDTIGPGGNVQTGAAATAGVQPKLTDNPETFTRRRGLRIFAHVNLTDLLTLPGATGPTGVDDTRTVPAHSEGSGVGGDPGVVSTDRTGEILTAQLKDWLARHGSLATVTPVIDMGRLEAVDRHDPPTWMAELVRMRDQHCVYPGCTKSAWDTDLDHIERYVSPDDGGPPGQTRPDNLACLCRRHHLVKTSGRWRYERTPDDNYLWTNRHAHQFLVTRFGTINLTLEQTA